MTVVWNQVPGVAGVVGIARIEPWATVVSPVQASVIVIALRTELAMEQ